MLSLGRLGWLWEARGVGVLWDGDVWVLVPFDTFRALLIVLFPEMAELHVDR